MRACYMNAHVYKCHLHMCASAPFDNLLRITEDSSRSGDCVHERKRKKKRARERKRESYHALKQNSFKINNTGD